MSALAKPSKRGTKPKKPMARKARPRQRSKSPAAIHRRMLDGEWARVIRESDRERCARCLGPGTDAHHVASRRYGATRHLFANGIFLCRKDHVRAHKHPITFRAWFIEYYPQRWQAIQIALERAHGAQA